MLGPMPSWLPRTARSRPVVIWLAICAIAGSHAVVLRILRLAELWGSSGEPRSLVLGAWSDAAFHASLAALGLGLLLLAGERWLARLVRGGLLASVAIVAVLDLVAHRFQSVTGTPLDREFLAFSLQRSTEVAPVVASAMPWFVWLHLLMIPALALAAAMALLPGRGMPRAPLLATVALVSSASLLALAARPPVGDVAGDGARAPLFSLLMKAEPVFAGGEPEDLPDFHDRRLVRRADGPSRSLAIIILESTRAFSVTPYAPEVPTTPFLAELAERSLLVERAYSVTPHTSKALVSILCGLPPAPLLRISEAIPGGLPGRCLPELLAEQGYRTGYFQSATGRYEDRGGLVSNMGFEDFFPAEKLPKEGFERANYFGKEDWVMLEPSRKWLAEHAHRPHLAVYLANTPHHPYDAPRRFGRLKLSPEPEFNRYLNAVRYVDFFVRELMEQYRQLGLDRDTVFVVVGDHGEGFGEHGLRQHDEVIYEEGLRVPLIIHDPSAPREVRVTGPATQLDILPSVVGRLGFRLEGTSGPGTSLDEPLPDRAVYSSCYRPGRCLARFEGNQKLIHFFGSRRDELFDVVADPGERTNLALGRGAEVAEWKRDALEWYARSQALHRPSRARAIRPYVRTAPPLPRRPFAASFGRYVELLGIDPPAATAPGSTAVATYHLRLLERLPPGYELFVHGEADGRFVNLDHVPVGGLYPFEEWIVGEYVSDVHRIRIPPNWPADHMDVYLGVYHPRHGRLPISGQDSSENRLHVMRIDVRQPSASAH